MRFSAIGVLFATLSVSAAVAAAPKIVPRIDLDVRDADVHDVLRLIAEVGRINLVVADGVQGRVTVKLRNVPWTDALAVVLKAHGLGQEREGGVLLVDTLENLTRQQAARAARAAARVKTERLVTVMIPLSYAQAKDLEPLVRSMLTERGTVAVDERTNVLIVTDVPDRVSRVRGRLSP